MSFREEERQKSNCPSRGLGLAAAAIGIGVGAAMYYFFSKRPENPHGEGSTASEWHTETLGGCNCDIEMDVDSDGYTTVSENITSDTSVHDDEEFNDASITRSINNSGSYDSETDSYSNDSINQGSEMDDSFSNSDTSESSHTCPCTGDETQENMTSTANNSFETGYLTLRTTLNTSVSSSDSSSDVAAEWDVTNSSQDVPEYSGSRSSIRRFFGNISTIISPRRRRNRNRMTEEEQLNILRDQAFRERPWTTEECSICFEVIRREQEVMTLPCTHHFHQGCILPWLQEQQTCPNCRKRIE